jgi:hypothetical protein
MCWEATPNSHPPKKPAKAPAKIFTSLFIRASPASEISEPRFIVGRIRLRYFALFFQEFVELYAHVSRNAVRIMILEVSAELNSALESFEEIEAGFAVPDMLFKYEAFFLIELTVNIFRELIEYLLTVLAVVLFAHDCISVLSPNFRSNTSRIKRRAR